MIIENLVINNFGVYSGKQILICPLNQKNQLF